jgi:ribonuclease HI
MISAYCDGACRGGNPGDTSCAFVIYDGDKEIFRKGTYLGPDKHTNNYAEYMGLITLLSFMHEKLYNGQPLTRVLIFCDSQVVVQQVNQEWPVKAESLTALNATAYALKVRGKHVLQHIHGHDGILGNETADEICNEILDEAENINERTNV